MYMYLSQLHKNFYTVHVVIMTFINFSYMKNFLPLMLMVFPIPRSLGDTHSFTSSSDISNTTEGKLATGERANMILCNYMYMYIVI